MHGIAIYPMGVYSALTVYPHGVLDSGKNQSMRDETQRRADARLAKIEGQIRAVRKMVAEDRYCIDVVRQVQAARSALNSLESLIIDDHVDTCVQHALDAERPASAERRSMNWCRF